MTNEVRNHTGIVGWISEIKQSEPGSVFVFQLPRSAQHMSPNYMAEIKENMKRMFPEQNIMVIPGDINIYEILSEDMLTLKLKGIF